MDEREPNQHEPIDKRQERHVFLAKDTPVDFLAQLEALAAGDFALLGIPEGDDERAE
jgi:hypothetical protein